MSSTEWPGGSLSGVEVRCACGSTRVSSMSVTDKKGRTKGVVWFCRDCRSRYEVRPICPRCGGRGKEHQSWCSNLLPVNEGMKRT